MNPVVTRLLKRMYFIRVIIVCVLGYQRAIRIFYLYKNYDQCSFKPNVAFRFSSFIIKLKIFCRVELQASKWSTCLQT